MIVTSLELALKKKQKYSYLVNLKARDIWRQKDIGTVNDAESFNVQVGPLGSWAFYPCRWKQSKKWEPRETPY